MFPTQTTSCLCFRMVWCEQETLAGWFDIADLLVEFGSTAHLSKLDHCAAFKLVPFRSSLIKFQGF